MTASSNSLGAGTVSDRVTSAQYSLECREALSTRKSAGSWDVPRNSSGNGHLLLFRGAIWALLSPSGTQPETSRGQTPPSSRRAQLSPRRRRTTIQRRADRNRSCRKPRSGTKLVTKPIQPRAYRQEPGRSLSRNSPTYSSAGGAGGASCMRCCMRA